MDFIANIKGDVSHAVAAALNKTSAHKVTIAGYSPKWESTLCTVRGATVAEIANWFTEPVGPPPFSDGTLLFYRELN